MEIVQSLGSSSDAIFWKILCCQKTSSSCKGVVMVNDVAFGNGVVVGQS